MCQIIDEIESRGIAKGRAEGRAKGRTEGKAEPIYSCMEALGKSADVWICCGFFLMNGPCIINFWNNCLKKVNWDHRTGRHKIVDFVPSLFFVGVPGPNL